MASNFYFFVIFRLNLECYEKKLFPFNFRQALKYRSTKKKKILHLILDLNTQTLVCDVEALTIAPYGLITDHALDRLNEISFHYFHPLPDPELPLRTSSVQWVVSKVKQALVRRLGKGKREKKKKN